MGTSGRISHGACRLLVLSLLAFTSMLPAPADAAAAKDRSAPTTPTNLRVTGTTASSVSLAWNASTDKGGVTASGTSSSTAAGSGRWYGIRRRR
jgi:hypothetical protein